MAQFIYRPSTGDRVFAYNPTPAIAVVEYPNGSRHIFGGIALEVAAAEPNRHWRARAAQVASTCVQAFGGIAADAQGVVTIVVPASAAPRAAELLTVAGAVVERKLDDVGVDALAIQAGRRLDADGRWAPVSDVSRGTADPTVTEVTVQEMDGRAQIRVTVRDALGNEEEEYQLVPASWLPATWQAGYASGALEVPAEPEYRAVIDCSGDNPEQYEA